MPDKMLEVDQRAAAMSPPLKSAEPTMHETEFHLNAPYKEAPSCILPNLYLGTMNSAASGDLLQQLNVTHIINVAEEEDNPYEHLDNPSAGLHHRQRKSISLIASQSKFSKLSSNGSFASLTPVMESEARNSIADPFSLVASPLSKEVRHLLASPTVASLSSPTQAIAPLGRKWPPAYKKFPWSHNQENIIHDFSEAFDIINSARLKREGVLVHCQLGVSRSGIVNEL
jgi:hypothetical protein